MRKPLYPHVPKRKEPLYPHRAKSRGEDSKVIEPFNIHLRAFWEDDMENVEKLIRKLDTNTLKKLYGMTIEVTPGQFFPNPRTGVLMVGDTRYFHGKPYLILLGTKPSPRVVYHEIAHAIGIEDEELAMKFAIEQEARLKSRGDAEIDQIIADLNLLREERVWIDTFKTPGASLIHLQSGETATIIEPPEDFTSPNYADRAMQVKWADGSEMVVDSNDFAPSSLQKQIAEITHGKPIPKFPTAEGKATPIVHQGTEPEGIKIADELGIRYDGIQKGIGDIPDMMLFTDVRQTETTFAANSLGEARTRLEEVRAAFEAAL